MNDSNHTKPENKNRILYIDLIRAYAILMMVQGHSIDLTLAPQFRDPAFTLYAIWEFFRGTTAPIFFFSAGTIFSYLFLRAQAKNEALVRMKKGLTRGANLVLIGYLLVFNVFAWFSIPPDWIEYPHQFAVSVLHCIGVGLILLSLVLYLLRNFNKYLTIGILMLIASCFFLFYPDVERSEWVANLILPLKAYFTRTEGTYFPLVPWLGYLFYGAMLGIVLQLKDGIHKRWYFILGFISVGLLGHFYSVDLLDYIYKQTLWDNIAYLRDFDFLYFRLAHVFVFVGIFAIISYADKYIPNLVFVIGRNTLLIYIAQALLLYSFPKYLGFYYDIAAKLTPWGAVLAALVVEIIAISFIAFMEKLNKKHGRTLIKLK
jgi:uncharacterized membrane protein